MYTDYSIPQYLDVKELADELADLREQQEDTDVFWGELDRKRLEELEDFERELGTDLWLVARDCWTFISEDSFPAYAQEYAEQTMEIPEGWPFDCIDWKDAASDLSMDFTSVEWEGESYYYQWG